MKKAYLFAGVSILLWSSVATITKLLLGVMDSYQVLCVSSLFAFLALLGINICTGNTKKLRTFHFKDILIIVLIGLPGTLLYNVFLYLGTDKLLASQAFIINYLWPIMSVVFACVLLKEKMSTRKSIAFALSFLGVITVAGNDLMNFQSETAFGMALCVLAAVSYGAFTALNQKWHYDKPISVMLASFSTFVLTLVINLFRGTQLQLDAFQVLGLGWNGIFVMAVATTTWAIALDSGKTAVISNLAYITPFLSLVWTALFLHEPISIWSVAGLVIIILGILIQLKDNKK